jgi:hypothetical protein
LSDGEWCGSEDRTRSSDPKADGCHPRTAACWVHLGRPGIVVPPGGSPANSESFAVPPSGFLKRGPGAPSSSSGHSSSPLRNACRSFSSRARRLLTTRGARWSSSGWQPRRRRLSGRSPGLRLRRSRSSLPHDMRDGVRQLGLLPHRRDWGRRETSCRRLGCAHIVRDLQPYHLAAARVGAFTEEGCVSSA